MVESTNSAIARRIIEHLERDDYQPLKQHELARALRLGGSERAPFRHALYALARSGKVVRLRKNRWALPVRARQLTGRIRIHAQRFGFVTPEGPGEDIFIPERQLGTALDGDLVVVGLEAAAPEARPRRPPGAEKRAAGRVVRVVERARTRVVGLLRRTAYYWYVIPDNPRFHHTVRVREFAPLAGTPCDLDKVVVRLDEWEDRFRPLTGVVDENLGPAARPGVDVLSVIRDHGLDPHYPDDAVREAERHPTTPPARSLEGRRDLRPLLAFTIDPEDARDYDDAVSLSRTADGHWRLGVHIADVPHYVMPGSRLDEEAFNRGNSVYLVDRAIPMLPPYLTTEVCSLVPHRDRLCHTAEMILSDEGLVLRAETFSSVIHSKARLNYDQVQDFFDGKDGHGVPAEIQEVLARMRPLARALRRHRMAAGAIDLAIPEIKCVLDSDGHPLAVMKRGAKEAYQLIEEFMLSANCVVAARLRDSGGPALYRVHEPPDEEQWAAMEADLKNLGVTDLDELRRRVAELVLRFAREPLSYVLHLAVLRNFKRARYAANLVGHFGLAFPCYTHFTSPVRRYPDLAVHRLLNAIEQRRPGPYSLEDAARIAAHCSATEENADDAETESVELKRIEFYRDLLQGGQTGPFEGIVVSVVPKGLIVELGETLQRGLIPFSSMMDDYYEVVPGKGMARGRRRHAVWSLGRPVRVLITRVDTARRRVDFVLFAGDSAPPAARRKKARPK